ncbi:entericidin A/B family lipoprotein [Idiomarina sp.]|jgi:predicted small secreted protein|nr:entericidin A/B family lipoprotein [Idiomarina sp.]MEC7644250.1 entericidin A/B family lipoprotein [Pseudomonadota bacterium]NQZ03817.1 entericidin A/B family lipoprotein [Idiomarina sp.]
MKRYFAMLIAVLGLASCSTVEGMGQDIEDAGEAIEESADENGA